MKILFKIGLGVLFGAGLIASSAGDSSAVLYPFTQITNNSGTTYTDFTMEVLDLGGNQVKFVLSNAGSGAIDAAYFDNRGGLLGVFNGYVYSGTVSFNSPANPDNLPAGNNLSPPFATNFSFGANNGPDDWRVNPGESLGLTFYLASGKSFADVDTALINGQLRIGEHVQSLANGKSESFVTTPIPGALLLFGSGLAGLVGIGRRRRK